MLTTVAAGRTWQYSHNLGRIGNAGDSFQQPVGVAAAKDDVLWVINRGIGNAPAAPYVRLAKWTVKEEFLGEFGRLGEEPGQFVYLSSLALDEDENVYVSDEWLHRITMFDQGGKFLGIWGDRGDGEGQLNGPSGLAFDGDGNLLVVNSLNSRVQKFTKAGRYLGGFGSKGSGRDGLDMPWGITTDAEGKIYVADWNNHRVQKFAPGGAYLATFGHPGPGPGSLKHPSGVAVDGDGDVYVCDWMQNRVVIFAADTSVITYLYGDAHDLSRLGMQSVEVNPDVKKATRRADLEPRQLFYMPVACTFDPSTSRLIVADTQRHRLQVYVKEKGYQDPQFNL